jgi:hypothetical protein
MAMQPGNFDTGWQAFLESLETVPLAARFWTFDEETADPYLSGIYIHAVACDVVYVGQSLNLLQRRRAHLRAGLSWEQEWWLGLPDGWRWDSVAWMWGVEHALIAYLCPTRNRELRESDLSDAVLQHLRQSRFALPR